MRKRKYTTLPCGLRLRLDVRTGDFDLRGDMGQNSANASAEHTHLTIIARPKNLMALSAFFLARAQEARENGD